MLYVEVSRLCLSVDGEEKVGSGRRGEEDVENKNDCVFALSGTSM